MTAEETAPALGLAARQRIRAGLHTGRTHHLAPGNVQANLVILPVELATDFLRFCELNPRACPLIAMSEPGNPFLPTLGNDVDVRSDLPLYRVWREGRIVAEPTDIGAYWRADLTAFLIGCSNSWEDALMDAGLPLLHRSASRSAPTFRTTQPTVPAGPFHGPLVVSMRSFSPADAVRAVQITSRYPFAHGAPVHIGRPDLLGIADIDAPEYGDAVPMPDDHIPVFWACGVTPQAIVADRKIDFCITHAPGHMLVTDIRSSTLATG